MSNVDWYQIVGLIISFAGFAVVIIFFIAQNKINRQFTKREIYQRLELASIDLFRFEHEFSDNTWRLYDENYLMPDQTSKEYREIINHTTQIVNLFEMIVEFEENKIVDEKIFSTWVPWFWEMTQLKNFVQIWHTIKWNYTQELQDIIDMGIHSDGDWNMYINKINEKYNCIHIAKLLIDKNVEEKSFEIFKNLEFSWGTQADKIIVDDLVDIFVRNVDNKYISHGEVIVGRANNLHEWKVDFSEIMKKEFLSALTNNTKSAEYKQLCICKGDNQIIGIALIEFNMATNVSILSDIVIDNKFRGQNIGDSFISWIEKELKANNIRHIFLESGIHNKAAHEFFENSGYNRSSIVMAKKL